MLEARIKSAATFRKFTHAITELATQAIFEPKPDALNIQALDPLHVALVSAKLYRDAFTSYKCDSHYITQTEVDFGLIKRMLKPVDDNHMILLKTSDHDDYLSIIFEAPSLGRIAEYDMRMDEMNSPLLAIPDIKHDATISMPSSQLSRIIGEIMQFELPIRIDVSAEGIRFSSEGGSQTSSVLLTPTDGKPVQLIKTEASITLEDRKLEHVGDSEKKRGDKARHPDSSADEPISGDYNNDDDDKVFIQIVRPINATFNFYYLEKFANAGFLSSRVLLKIGTDVPLLVRYTFCGGFVDYYLAPRLPDL